MIAVIIVNYGTAELTQSALESVLHHEWQRDIEVHVLDNASPGRDAALLSQAIETRGWSDRVTLWVEKTNHGFGGGNNVVLHALAARPEPPELVFLLNPDAELLNDAITKLAAALEAEPQAAAAGAALFNSEGGEDTAAFRFPSRRSELARTANFGPLDRYLGDKRNAWPVTGPISVVEWVSGAAVMFRLDAIQALDFFDPAYFLYYEEVDLMHRLAQGGYLTLYVRDAHVLHVEGASTGQFGPAERRRRPRYIYESWRRYFVAAQGRSSTILTALILMLAAAFNVVHSSARGRTPWLPIGFFGDHLRYVLMPLFQRDPRA